jgi:hypothetical protein
MKGKGRRERGGKDEMREGGKDEALRFKVRAGLSWDLYGTTLAALRSIGFWWDSIKGFTGASCGHLVGPGRLAR